MLASRLNAVKPSPTIAVTTKAAELKAAGNDVIGLGAGEPDFDTPDHIKQAAIEAINAGQTKYTAVGGTPELKKAIIGKFQRDNGLEYAANQVLVACGAKQILFNAMLATLDAGDEVIIPAPFWVSYPDMVAVAEGKSVIAPCSEDESFKLTPAKLEAAITDKTKWVIINSPSNPTGGAYSADELKALGEVLKKYPNVLIMSDDIYEYLVYDGFEFVTFASANPELKDRTLIVNGVSKAYSMTGWRIGYAAGPADLIKAIASVQSHSTSNPCSISQAASVAAINGDLSFLEEWKKAFVERRDMVVGLLNDIDGISCRTPNGAFYVFPKCSDLFGSKTPSGKLIENSTDFAAYLLEEALVAVVMGDAFGLDGYFRISYATSEDALRKACARIKDAVAKLDVNSKAA